MAPKLLHCADQLFQFKFFKVPRMETQTLKSFASAFVLGIGLISSNPAAATIVTFDNLPGSNGSTYTSYTESGVTVSKLSGSGCVAKSFGNPQPDVFLGDVCDSTNSGSYKISGAGLLSLNSIDFSANNGSLNYHLQGFLNNIAIWDTNSSLAGPSSTFVTISGFAATAVDFIQMDLTANGSSANFDNINVSQANISVPEPTSFALLGLALAGLGFMRKRNSA
jgi:hypothetical protein